MLRNGVTSNEFDGGRISFEPDSGGKELVGLLGGNLDCARVKILTRRMQGGRKTGSEGLTGPGHSGRQAIGRAKDLQ